MTPLACRVRLPSLLPSFQKLSSSAAVLSCAGIELKTADRDTGTTESSRHSLSLVIRPCYSLAHSFVGDFLHREGACVWPLVCYSLVPSLPFLPRHRGDFYVLVFLLPLYLSLENFHSTFTHLPFITVGTDIYPAMYCGRSFALCAFIALSLLNVIVSSRGILHRQDGGLAGPGSSVATAIPRQSTQASNINGISSTMDLKPTATDSSVDKDVSVTQSTAKDMMSTGTSTHSPAPTVAGSYDGSTSSKFFPALCLRTLDELIWK